MAKKISENLSFQGFFDGAALSKTAGNVNSALAAQAAPGDDDGAVDGWGDDAELGLDSGDEINPPTAGNAGGDAEDGPGWDVGDEDLDLPEDDKSRVVNPEDGNFFNPPVKGTSQVTIWMQSPLVVDHILSGNFESAFRLLHQQVGVVNFEPYEVLFMNLFSQSHTSLTGLPNQVSMSPYPLRNWKDATPKSGLPISSLKLSALVQNLQACYQLTTAGKFAEAIEKFQLILLAIPLVIVDTKQEILEAKQLLQICREYILGLCMETLRKTLPKTQMDEQKRQCEMAAYFTHCNLQPVHQILTLRTALNMFFKLKNYKTAGSFARRLLELGPRPEVSQQVRKILQACDKNPIDEQKLDYDEHNPFTLCGISYTPIYKGNPEEKCGLCETSYLPEHTGKLCNVCKVAEIGKRCTGMLLSNKFS